MLYKSLLVLSLFTHSIKVSSQKISIEAKPGRIFIEQANNKQIINADFLVKNLSADTFTLTKLAVSIFDNDNLVHNRFLDNNGTAPSIMLIPNRKFNGTSSHLIFNPFTDFNLTTPLTKLVYEWTFTDNQDNETVISTTINPQKFIQKENYYFPLKGRVLIYDGHDFYSHHRRFDYEFAPIKGLGISANFMRYAYDFILLDENNKQSKAGSKKDVDFFGYAQPVYAVGNGTVIYASNKHKDDKKFDIPGIATNALELYGNCIAILHADSAISIYGHLMENSLTVKSGDKVQAQQAIAKIGVSGSSFLPHLHFEMRTSILHKAEGVPSYFSNVYLLEGKNRQKLNPGLVETGNIIEAR